MEGENALRIESENPVALNNLVNELLELVTRVRDIPGLELPLGSNELRQEVLVSTVCRNPAEAPALVQERDEVVHELDPVGRRRRLGPDRGALKAVVNDPVAFALLGSLASWKYWKLDVVHCKEADDARRFGRANAEIAEALSRWNP